MSQLIAQMFQGGAVKVKHDLLLVVFQVTHQNITTKSTRKRTTAQRCDIRRDILEFFVAQ